MFSFRLKKDMLNVMVQTIAIFIFQVCISLFIFQNSVLEELNKGIEIEVPSLALGLARFITGLAMHTKMTKEIGDGMNKMKYAINHKWKFSRWRYAFLSGLGQTLIGYLVAVISYFVIIFDTTVLDIVKDFVALEVISQLDEYFFVEYDEEKEKCKQIVAN